MFRLLSSTVGTGCIAFLLRRVEALSDTVLVIGGVLVVYVLNRDLIDAWLPAPPLEKVVSSASQFYAAPDSGWSFPPVPGDSRSFRLLRDWLRQAPALPLDTLFKAMIHRQCGDQVVLWSWTLQSLPRPIIADLVSKGLLNERTRVFPPPVLPIAVVKQMKGPTVNDQLMEAQSIVVLAGLFGHNWLLDLFQNLDEDLVLPPVIKDEDPSPGNSRKTHTLHLHPGCCSLAVARSLHKEI